MKEQVPDYEDEKIRTWLRKPEDRSWDDTDRDPTMMCIDDETEELFESRTYRLRPSRDTFALVLGILMQMVSDEVPPQVLVSCAEDMIDTTTVKFLAKRRKEDGRVSHLLVGIGGGLRHLLDRQEWAEEDDYHRMVHRFEQSAPWRDILSPPLVVTREEWGRYADGFRPSGDGAEAKGGTQETIAEAAKPLLQ